MDEGETFEVEEGEQQEEEEEDPIFVLTDEWRDFFAKSEAKRRLAKQQSRKKGKNQIKKHLAASLGELQDDSREPRIRQKA